MVYDPIATPMYQFKPGDKVISSEKNPVFPTMPSLWQ